MTLSNLGYENTQHFHAFAKSLGLGDLPSNLLRPRTLRADIPCGIARIHTSLGL